MISSRKALAVATIALSVVCVVALSACGNQQPANNTSANTQAQEEKVLTVGYDTSIFGGDDFSGAVFQLTKSTAEFLDTRMIYKSVEFGEIENAINNGDIDCYWGCYTITGREEKFAWTEAYSQSLPILEYRVDDKLFGDVAPIVPIDDVSQMPIGKVIATVAGATTYDYLTDAEKKAIDNMGTFREYPSLWELRDALDKGEVDMTLTEAAAATMLYDSEKYASVRFSPNQQAAYGVAFKKGNEETAKKMTEAMKKAYSSGTIKSNLKTWAKEKKKPDETAENIIADFDSLWLLK